MQIDIAAMWSICKDMASVIAEDDFNKRKNIILTAAGDKATNDMKEATTKEELFNSVGNDEDLYILCSTAFADASIRPDKESLTALNTNFHKLIEYIKVLLQSMSCDSERVFVYMFMSCESTIDYSQRGLIDSEVNDDSETVKIKFNPLFIEKNTTIKEVITKIVAEILRLFYLHPSVYISENPTNDSFLKDCLEKGSDMSVTSILTKYIISESDGTNTGASNIFKLPKDMYTASKFEAKSGVSTKNEEDIKYYYAVYRAFCEKKKNQNTNSDTDSDESKDNEGAGQNGEGEDDQDNNKSKNGKGKSGKGSKSGKGKAKSDGEGEGESTQKRPTLSNASGVGSPSNNNGHDIHNWQKNNASNTETTLKGMIQKAVTAITESRGTLPSYVSGYLEELFKPPKIRWQDELRRYIGIIPIPYRKTRLRPSRRCFERCDLSGRLPKYTCRVVVCLDTSGSMSDEMLNKCLNEVAGIVSCVKAEITVIECDCEVACEPYTIQPGHKNKIHFNMHGRGGTAFTPAIEWINNHNFKDAIMIYFTDGYAEESIPRPKTYRNIWVVANNAKNLSISPSYGPVIALDMDDD